MDQKKQDRRLDPEQRKWDDAGPEKATGRTGGAGGPAYNEGPKKAADAPGTTQGIPDTRRGPLEQRGGRSDAQQGMAGGLGGPDQGTNHPATGNERRFGGSHTAGTRVPKEEDSEWSGGTPEQGPTTGGMGAAGGGHDTDETDVWGDKDRE